MLRIGISGFEGLAKINPEHLTTRVVKALIPVWRASIKEFIGATAESMTIDTGMSIATLRPLASDIRYKGRLEAIISGKGAKRSRGEIYDSYQFPGPRSKKSASLGERMGSNAYDYSFPDNSTNPQFTFSFNIVVLQFHLNNNGLGAKSNQAWQAIEAGQQAFIDYWYANSGKAAENTIEGYLNYV